MPALDQTCNNCGKKGHFARTRRQRENYKNKLRNVTETENRIGEESNESESSIYRIGRVNRIMDRNKYLTTTVKINGTEKEFIIDTGSPISIMPVDNKIMKESEIQKVRNRNQDVNKNEVKFRGKIPVDVEYENNKQKMQLLITERNDITPLLGMDRLNKFKLTIGNIRFDENNQSKRRKNYREISGPIPKRYDSKRYRNKHTTETGTLSGETKSKTNPSPITRSSRKRN